MITYSKIDAAREAANISRKELCQLSKVRLKTYERGLAKGSIVPEHDELMLCFVIGVEKQRKAA